MRFNAEGHSFSSNADPVTTFLILVCNNLGLKREVVIE